MNRYPKQRFKSGGRLRGGVSATSVALGSDFVTQDSFPSYSGFVPDYWDECRLPRQATSVSKARRFIVDQLSQWSLAQELQDDVVLVVSELVTNAIVHTTSAEVTCRLGIAESSVYVAIADQGLDPVGPQVCTEPLAERGRGLQLVDILAEDWGVTFDDGEGRVVWAVFRATPALGLR